MNAVSKASIKKIIETEVFIRSSERPIIRRSKTRVEQNGWIFDFRGLLLEGDFLNAITDLFLQQYEKTSALYIGGLESGSIPLIAGIVQKANRAGRAYDGFFIRKGRKKDMLMQLIEGKVTKERPIILVDDTINSGKSFIKQVEILEAHGYKVEAVWAILRYRDLDFYEYFHQKGIRIESLFELDEFTASLGVENITADSHAPAKTHFIPQWKFSSENPSYFYVVPKSDPTVDEKRVYVGSDTGIFWALNQHDGSIAWSYKVGFHPKGKGIFSSPALSQSEETVYFGAYDGNVYALNTETGKPRWIHMEADWIGSSPALAEDLGLLFVGLEFGLPRKRGGIAAIDIKTGKKVWQHLMPMYTHSSPLYISSKKQVVIGSNDGTAYLLNAKTGTLVWKFETGTPTKTELVKGFSPYDIKESFAYYPARDYIIFGNMAGELFILRRKTGERVLSLQADYGFYSTPCIYEDKVYASSIDRHVICFDLKTLTEKWRWNGGARIFASPVAIEGSIFIGGNTGRFTELDPETGKERSFAALPERITNKPAYNPKTKRFFVPTFANEIYCLERNLKTL